MFVRVASVAGALLAGLAVGLTFDLAAQGGQALAQYYPPPPQPYQSYPGRQLPPPVQADDDDLGPPRTFGFPGAAPPPPPPGVQYGGRPIYPQDPDSYPPPAPYPNGGPGYGGPAPDNAVRPPMSIGPDRAVASLPPDYQPETGPVQLPPQFRRAIVDYRTNQPAGTIVIDTPNTYLYLVLGKGKAMRYGIGVGREGFTWSGTERISNKAEWQIGIRRRR